jgi:ElaB/YqjD/DUF883 family membrane-anchored ribosome-binding protein
MNEPTGGHRVGSAHGPSAGADDDPQRIQVEIEHTRAEMSGTIEAIQDKLSPEILAEQAKEAARDVASHAIQEAKGAALEVTHGAVREVKEAAREVTGQAKDAAWDATVGRAEDAVTQAGETARGIGEIMLDTIKQHPVPAAIAGISLGWLFMNRSTGPSTRRAYTAYRGTPTVSSRYAAGRAVDEDRGMVDNLTEKVGDAADATQRKLGQVADSAGDMAGDVASSAGDMAGTAGEAAMDVGSTILETIKQNPIPAALTGIGLGYLYMNRATSLSTSNGGTYGRTRTGESYPGYGGAAYGTGRAPRPRAGQERDRVGEVVDAAGQMASSAGDTVSGMASSAGDTVSGMASSTGEIVGDLPRRAQRAGGRIGEMVESNPLVAAGVAATLGGAVGLMLPETRTEDQLLGKTRDSVMGRVGEVTDQTMDKVQQVTEQAKQEAQKQGLTA